MLIGCLCNCTRVLILRAISRFIECHPFKRFRWIHLSPVGFFSDTPLRQYKLTQNHPRKNSYENLRSCLIRTWQTESTRRLSSNSHQGSPTLPTQATVEERVPWSQQGPTQRCSSLRLFSLSSTQHIKFLQLIPQLQFLFDPLSD